MNNKSFQLLRTNPALTTNIKLVVNADYNLYLESFNTNRQLSNHKFKHFTISKNDLYEDQLINFYDGLSSQLAFDVKDDKDVTNVFTKYNNQFDDIYWGGAKSIEDNWHQEDFEYFAPLFVNKKQLPEGFIVLRVDDATAYEEDNDFKSSILNKDNFNNQIVDKWKCVNFFDMRYQSDFGYFLYNNYVNNSRYPDKSFELDYRQYEYSKFYGIDYINGVYVTKSKFMKEYLYYEQPHFKLEKEILESFRTNNLVYPHILNLKFLYNDVPSTPDEVKNYSLNRYYGFYIDKLDFVSNLTSYITPELKDGYSLKNNIFVDENGVEVSNSPFVEEYEIDKNYWIQYDNDFYKVVRINKDGSYIFQIISDFDMSGLTFDDVNNRTCTINYESGYNYRCRTYDNPSGYTNYISGFTEEFSIDTYYEEGEKKTMFGDLYIINIDGIYHVLKQRNGKYYIQSDYAINSYPDKLEYWKGGKTSDYATSKPIYTYGQKPLSYPVYRLKFTDIKDFDFDRVDTGFADFDYEKDTYNSTTEHKLYAVDYKDSSVINKNFMVHPRAEDGQYRIMNTSSEYVADDELYEIIFNDLTEIWKKNQFVVKWGVAGSNSNCDYPYKLNNSIDIGDIFNGTCDVLSNTPSENEKNLDYFYRIGNFISGNTSNIVRYLNQSTNIEVDLMGDFSKKFNLELYLKSDVDYFNYFFNNKSYFEVNGEDYIKTNIKYSTFGSGDKYTSPITIFKGLNISAINVKDIIRDNQGKILNIIKDTNSNNKYNSYKFSIILNDVYEYYDGTEKTTTNENGLMNNSVIDINTNSIHVFLNDKYENILIIINVKIPIQETLINLNNVPYFNEKYGLYYSKTLLGDSLIEPAYVHDDYDPSLITASNFIDCFDDMNTLSQFESGITYYYINSDGQSGSTGTINTYNSGNTMKDVDGWGKVEPPFVLNISEPELVETKKHSYDKSAIKGPSVNIYDKYPKYNNHDQKQKYNITEPLARELNLNIEESNYNTIYTGNEVSEPNIIYRYNGNYEPIFSNIPLFNNTYLYTNDSEVCSWDSNYKFDTTIENFGMIKELMFSKVNPDKSPLKLKNTEKDKSIYPMIDEYGYQYSSRFIFNSSWDRNFYVMTNLDQNINNIAYSNLTKVEYIVDPIDPKITD